MNIPIYKMELHGKMLKLAPVLFCYSVICRNKSFTLDLYIKSKVFV